MTASFFEKLTGASINEENIIREEPPQKINPQKNLSKKVEKKKKKISPPNKLGEEKTEEEIIKKEPLNMPKNKKIMNQEESIPTETEEKRWLEEVEGEEGQLTIDVYQTDSDIVIKSTIAGVNPEDIDISITNDMVTIRGKRMKDEKISTEDYYYQELYWGAFSRSVILPVEVDADRAKASIKNGILTIRLPKSEKIKTKKISVRTEE
jgi:HSP20 family protein